VALSVPFSTTTEFKGFDKKICFHEKKLIFQSLKGLGSSILEKLKKLGQEVYSPSMTPNRKCCFKMHFDTLNCKHTNTICEITSKNTNSSVHSFVIPICHRSFTSALGMHL